MFAVERQKIILEKLETEGAVWVSKLSQEFEVAEETIRRDLEKLEKKEALMRTHGGAVPIENSNGDLSLEKRKNKNTDIKIRLAKEAVGYISFGDTIFLDASTTTFYMAKEIKKMKNVTVITNSIRVINELLGAEGVKVISIGGIVSPNQSFVGSLAENSIKDNFFASKVFFSSKGISDDIGILESNEQECTIKQLMLQNSREKFFLCDNSKIGNIGFYKLAQLNEITHLITDGEISDVLKAKLEENEVRLLKV